MSGFNINSFKTNGLVYGGARPSLFEVFMSAPAGIGIDNVSVDKFRFVCKAAELPASAISTIDVPYFGRRIKVAGERAFADWSVTIINDEDFSVRAMFEAWSNALNRLVSNVRDPAISAEQYKVDLDIVQYGKDGTTIRSYKLIGAFPNQISGIALSWDSASAIEEFSVGFSYDYWIPDVESSNKKAGGVTVYGGLAQQDGVNGPA
jgi:hypothetical protein